MKPKGLVEVILYVQDMQAQVKFYRDIIGLDITHPQGVTDYSGEQWVTFDTGACTLALHAGRKGEPGAGAPTIVFEVDDIQAAYDHFRSHGGKLGDIRVAAPGVHVFDAIDREGNAIAFESHEQPIYG
jgi:predicted enzyme related to lactoylglutathione lyase